MRKKYCFFDIDGTIWDYERRIPESTVAAIRALRARGHEAFLCSGRSRGHIQAERLLSIGFDGIVSGCGTAVEYRGRREFLYEIPPETLVRTLEVLRRYQFQPILEGWDYLYFDTEYFGQDEYGSMLLAELGPHHRTIAEHWGSWRASKLSCDTKKGHVEECRQALAAEYDFLIHNPCVVEIVPRGFDKSTGIRWLCQHFDIPREDTVAFGDSTNDLGMLAYAGLGVAMGSGTEQARQAADLVTAGIHEDGILLACRKLGLI